MAVVRNFGKKELDRDAKHSEVEATICTVEADGEKFNQIDTYSSAGRALPSKVSEGLRLSEASCEQLMKTGSKFF